MPWLKKANFCVCCSVMVLIVGFIPSTLTEDDDALVTTHGVIVPYHRAFAGTNTPRKARVVPAILQHVASLSADDQKRLPSCHGLRRACD